MSSAHNSCYLLANFFTNCFPSLWLCGGGSNCSSYLTLKKPKEQQMSYLSPYSKWATLYITMLYDTSPPSKIIHTNRCVLLDL